MSTTGLYQVQIIATSDQDADFAASFPEFGTVVVEGNVGAAAGRRRR
jgi:predicted RNase H-like HicB family nuclease